MTEEKVTQKIAKLLSLSRSDNENEAGVSLSKAMKLAAKHDIDIDSVDSDGNVNNIDDNTLQDASARLEIWKRMLATGIGKVFACEVYTRKRYNAFRKPVFSIGIVGYKSDIEIVKHLYSTLVEQAQRIATRATKSYGGWEPKGRFRNSFLVGFSDRVVGIAKDKFEETATEEEKVGYGLILSRANSVAKHCEGRFSKGKTRTAGVSSDGYSRGYASGASASFSKTSIRGGGSSARLT